MGQKQSRRYNKNIAQDDFGNGIRSQRLDFDDDNQYLSDDDSGTCGVCYPKRIGSIYVTISQSIKLSDRTRNGRKS